MKEVYAIAEADCLVIGNSDTNEKFDSNRMPEPVICIPLGVWTDLTKAEAKCTQLNNEAQEEDKFVVKPLIVKME